MGYVDDIMDFLTFLLLLVVCLTVPFTIIMPIIYEKDNVTSVVASDKTAPQNRGYTLPANYDGTYSKLEAILVTQVQDPQMPAPREYRAGSTTVGVTPIYREDLRAIGYQVVSGLSGDSANARYRITYNYGATSSELDDYYSFVRVSN